MGHSEFGIKLKLMTYIFRIYCFKTGNVCCNEILGCFHEGWGEENLLTIVVVRRKMVHTSNKHQPNWFKFVRYSCCIISYPDVLSDLRFLFSMVTGTSQILLGMKI